MSLIKVFENTLKEMGCIVFLISLTAIILIFFIWLFFVVLDWGVYGLILVLFLLVVFVSLRKGLDESE